jgi:ferrochelatase
MSTTTHDASPYDAILIVGFGGPEGREDVMPFLENVLRGRPVPRERMLEVAEHYYHFGGVSPINGQVRALIAALEPELAARGVDLPVYWGNRNWHPMLTDTVRAMTEAGVRRALAVVLSAYSSYSSCRQYREDILRAREAVGPGAPAIDKMRVFYNHPDFVEVNARRVVEALEKFPSDRRGSAVVAFTAHSIPESMAANSRYEEQLKETCRLVAEASGVGPGRWSLVYQSRSGRPTDPWLGPDILDHLDDLKERGVREVVVQPVGFLSDHMEVLFDLDEEAVHRAEELGLSMVRAGTAGTDPRFVAMLGELIEERIGRIPGRRAIGQFPASHDVCPVDCCPPPPRPGRPAS